MDLKTEKTPDSPTAKAAPKPASVVRSPNQQRAALRRALARNPQDPRLLRAREALVNPQEVRTLARRGSFISYTRNDELFALDLATRLNEAGVHAWMDALHVPDDGDWHRANTTALKRSGLMLAVISPRAQFDAAVIEERRAFQATGKLILPAIYQTCDYHPDDFWLAPVDFTHDFERGLARLIQLLHPA